jgi:hypothetical protein
MSFELISAIYGTAALALFELRRPMTGEGIEPPLFLFVRQAPYLLGDPAVMRETRLELAMPIWKTGVIPASPLSHNFTVSKRARDGSRTRRLRCTRPALDLSSFSGRIW